MTDTQPPDPSGENRPPESGWRTPDSGWHAPEGGWAPPPPPSEWGAGPWRDPNGYGPSPGEPPQGGGPGYPPGGPYGYWPQPPPGGWGGPPGAGNPYGPGGWYGWRPPRPRRSLPSAVTALLLAVAVLVGLGIGHGVWNSGHGAPVSNPGNGGNSGSGFGFDPFGNNSGSGSGGQGSSQLSTAAATASNALVDIDTSLSYENDQAAGTGIVLTSDGYVLTNNHVITSATSIDATDIGNGQRYKATVIGYDRTHDVAVIKLQGASGLRTASIGNSSKLSSGEPVVGIGNAGGVGGTPSTAQGQIAALNQSIKAEDQSNGTTEQLTGLIETNCNIQPGDSGGALVDSSARVVGMDTAASTGFSFQTQGNQGFAIPIAQAISIASQIRAGQSSATVHIGPTAFLGVEVDTSQAALGTRGAVVSKPIAGGAAAAVGISAGSVITALGGSTVTSSAALTDLLGRYHPGDKVSISWTDSSGRSHTAAVTLATGPAA